ncbi:hypothetical protein BC941DRAFT_434166 [Chlamydoabsidia padenii]|nr:hypothetical protein BC941DRAFT_434166 [Chlamydoabsidia padenii]
MPVSQHKIKVSMLQYKNNHYHHHHSSSKRSPLKLFCAGGDKICYFCGSTTHYSSDCPTYA